MSETDDSGEGRTLYDRIETAQQYKEFIESPLTVACLDDQERYFFAALKRTDKPDEALDLWHRLRAVGRVREGVMHVIQDGELARVEIERQERIKEIGAPSDPIIRGSRNEKG